MILDSILEEWEKDSALDPSNLDKQSLDIPQLHAKYLKHHYKIQGEYRNAKDLYKEWEQVAYKYYSGRMSMDELKELNLKPFPHKVLKNDLARYIGNDEKVTKYRKRMNQLEDDIKIMESIIDSINRRSFQIKNYIDYMKFSNGMI
jgi:hypothetical protein|tara:strand:- start:205 stop:642 length:438 start_codon:yes stop_codon:yes gene_type:complete